ncbi:MAG: hypothetical protein J0M17_06925 [Planctomycetes bacterium]|nr:hypothetical protein [Planctomycetota bacterium]
MPIEKVVAKWSVEQQLLFAASGIDHLGLLRQGRDLLKCLSRPERRAVGEALVPGDQSLDVVRLRRRWPQERNVVDV